ncbi:hypothetical protein AB0D38_37105, partial [Streptomyces sp. NPDC048279]
DHPADGGAALAGLVEGSGADRLGGGRAGSRRTTEAFSPPSPPWKRTERSASRRRIRLPTPGVVLPLLTERTVTSAEVL